MRTQLYWLIRKDLVSECRAWQAWPETMLLGVLVAVVFSLQVDLPGDGRLRIAGAFLWLAILFAGLPTLERSFASEREERCLDGLLLFPIRPATVYLAKLAVNLIVLTVLACILTPLLAALSGVPLLASPGRMMLVIVLGMLGIAAVGTLLSSLVGGPGSRGSSLTLLVLPLVIPVLVAASEATRLVLGGGHRARMVAPGPVPRRLRRDLRHRGDHPGRVRHQGLSGAPTAVCGRADPDPSARL